MKMKNKILSAALVALALPLSVFAAPVIATATATFGDYFALGTTLCLGLASVLACKTRNC